MSEAKHTQGPWRYVHAPGYCGELIAQDGTTIAEFVVEPSLDNARLIAAAPELLAALKFIVSEWGYDGHGGELEDGESEVIDKVRAAIAKAEGGAA